MTDNGARFPTHEYPLNPFEPIPLVLEASMSQSVETRKASSATDYPLASRLPLLQTPRSERVGSLRRYEWSSSKPGTPAVRRKTPASATRASE